MLYEVITVVRYAYQDRPLFGYLYVTAVGIAVLRGAPAPDFSADLTGSLAAAFLPTLVLGLVFGGFSEEPGWRGFLLPRLQRRIRITSYNVCYTKLLRNTPVAPA